MISASTSPGRRRLLAHTLALGAVAACALLRFHPPEVSRFYPVCPVYQYLHLLCPGCGATRALAALLRGDLAGAFHWNPFFIAVLPFLLAFAALSYARALRAVPFRWPVLPLPAAWALLAAAAIFSFLRNIPTVHL